MYITPKVEDNADKVHISIVRQEKKYIFLYILYDFLLKKVNAETLLDR